MVIQSWAQLLVLVAAIAGVLAWQTHYIDKRVDDLRLKLDADIARLEAGLAHVRTELKAEIEQVLTELKAEIEQVRTELKAEIRELGTEIRELSKALVHPAR